MRSILMNNNFGYFLLPFSLKSFQTHQEQEISFIQETYYYCTIEESINNNNSYLLT